MRTIVGALNDLDGAARQRVVRWTIEKYGLQLAGPFGPMKVQSAGRAQLVSNSDATTSGAGVDLPSLYAACQPGTDAEKTLVVAYWLQEIEGSPQGIDAQNVNTQLKHLGHGVGNITRAFEKLMQNRPQLMIQTKKAGTTKQARKTYKVTLEGKHVVQQMNGERPSQ